MLKRLMFYLFQERAALRTFAHHVLMEGSWQGCDIDGGDAQDTAEKLGLIELRPRRPEDSIDGETEHYFPVWLAQNRAPGDQHEHRPRKGRS